MIREPVGVPIMATIGGACLCGAVRLTARRVADEMHACHCGMCRRWGGGPLLAVQVEADDAEWQGGETIAVFDSSPWAERGFCSRCGTHLFYRIKATGTLEVPHGLFDGDLPVRLASEIFADRASHAYALAGDRPRLTEAQTIAMFAPQGDAP